IPALPGFVEITQTLKIDIQVTAGDEQRADPDRTLGIVEVDRQDRHVRSARDMPETRAPFLHGFARACRGDAEPWRISALKACGHLLDQAMGTAALDRDAAELAHDPAERPDEQLALAHVRCVDTDCDLDQQAPETTRPRRMRRSDQHESC